MLSYQFVQVRRIEQLYLSRQISMHASRLMYAINDMQVQSVLSYTAAPLQVIVEGY